MQGSQDARLQRACFLDVSALADTGRGYESWIRVHILPKVEKQLVTDLQTPSRGNVVRVSSLCAQEPNLCSRVLRSLWNLAMWKQDIPLQVNPISLLRVKNASKRMRQPRVLTVEQFRLLVSHLKEPSGQWR